MEIRKFKDPILRKQSLPLKRVTKEILVLADNMLETMYAAEGVGLAAPQVGVPVRLIVVDVGEGPMVLFNPRVVASMGEAVAREGCLSIPGVTGEVTRADRVIVEALSPNGSGVRRVEGEGLLARALQHEIDHLDGVLFIDKATDIVEERVDE
ncbi:MAG: peptide deformylase [Firmicutes bacterium]|nr:peptide deformylase [Bacillota bacterium]MDH7495621.1 peptide deformylase [Bacillota bacterium]